MELFWASKQEQDTTRSVSAFLQFKPFNRFLKFSPINSQTKNTKCGLLKNSPDENAAWNSAMKQLLAALNFLWIKFNQATMENHREIEESDLQESFQASELKDSPILLAKFKSR